MLEIEQVKLQNLLLQRRIIELEFEKMCTSISAQQALVEELQNAARASESESSEENTGESVPQDGHEAAE